VQLTVVTSFVMRLVFFYLRFLCSLISYQHFIISRRLNCHSHRRDSNCRRARVVVTRDCAIIGGGGGGDMRLALRYISRANLLTTVAIAIAIASSAQRRSIASVESLSLRVATINSQQYYQ